MARAAINPSANFRRRKPKPHFGVIWAFLLTGCGCSNQQDLMPLSKGREWQYYLRRPVGPEVVKVAVAGGCRVGLDDGWLLTGVSGDSRLTWKGGKLYASELPSTRFDPPLQLLDANSNSGRWNYAGTCDGRVGRVYTTASASQVKESCTVGGVTKDTIHVTLRIKIGNSDCVLDTWYARGIGIFKQEQRIGDQQVVALEWISG